MEQIVFIGIGEYQIGVAPIVIATLGLGSCIGIAILDPISRIGGLAHIMLPDSSTVSDKSVRSKFADTAVVDMVNDMIRLGAKRERMVAKIAGGAHMFGLENDVLKVGQRNIIATKEILNRLRIPISSEEVGGSVGRTVHFYTENGKFQIKSVNSLVHFI